MTRTLAGKVVMITGGAAGIGAACVRKFAEKGALVSVVDVDPVEREESGGFLFTRGDIREETTRRRFLQRTTHKFGRVDVLVNNAGVGIYAPASQTVLDEMRAMFEVNVFAALGMSQMVISQFRLQGAGLVVNIGSVGGLVTLPWCTLYCASKYALHAVSDGLRRELRGSGIGVMTVIPGIVDTQFREHVISGRVPGGVARLRRVISADRLAGAIANGIEKGHRRVFCPQVGRVFGWMDQVLPGLMDRYLQKQWNSSSEPRNAWKNA